ncbi:MAG: TetR/AcrR family transcriptional regulator [Deltaproteobacteria bacterium]|nr:TetR/AcrR family transcriptional regulator [Deltaproteobacteria bacterium]
MGKSTHRRRKRYQMKKRKLTSRYQKALETKERIFQVASQLILKKGFDNTTLKDISEKAGISKGLFYHYFKSKTDLIIESYNLIDAEFEQELKELDADTAPLDRILLTVNTMARHAKQRGLDAVRQIYKGQLDAATASFISKKRPFYRTIREAVVALQDQGVMSSEIPPDEYADCLMACARGVLYDWCLHKGKYNIEQGMDKYFREILLPGYRSMD